jgi:hypothetical protein
MYYSCLFTLATILIIVLLSVVVYSTQCRQFKIRAQKVKEDLESSVPGVSVTINPQKVMCIMIFARLCFVVYQNVLVVYPFFLLVLMLFSNSQPRRGCLEIREEGGEVFLSLLVMLFITTMFLSRIGA